MLLKSIKYIAVLFVSVSFGQNIQTQKVINEYANYINGFAFYILLSHYVVKDYNLEINNRFQSPKEYYTLNNVFDFYGKNN
ncbi:MAG: hypothetical protein L3J08_06865 [Flavobacteriaceae bacterium]|nr:hypothetical protein [Flavobacteriaceae bacterium]